MMAGHKRKLSDPSDAERLNPATRPVRTTQLGLGTYVGSALRYVSQLFWGTRDLLNVLVVPVAGAHKKRILAPEATLRIPGAWRPEFDDCSISSNQSYPKRKNASQSPSKPITTTALPFPPAPHPKITLNASSQTLSSTSKRIPSTSSIIPPKHASQAVISNAKPSSVPTPSTTPKPSQETFRISTKTPLQTRDDDIWLNAVMPAPNRFPKLQVAKPLTAPAKRLFRRTSFLSKKKARELSQVSSKDGIAGKYTPTPLPKQSDSNVRTYRTQLLKRALNERSERAPPRPTAIQKPARKPTPKIPTIQIEEPQTPALNAVIESSTELIPPTQDDSPLDVSMIDVFTPEVVCKAPPPTVDYIGDIVMSDAPPVKTLRFAESVVNGKPVLLAPKLFYKELAINELPDNRSPYRQPPPEYDMENPSLYDTPPDRFAASRNLSPANPSEEKEEPMVDDLLAIINEWHAELKNTPDVEKPSKHYYDWIDRRVQYKQEQEAAHAAYQRKIKEVADEKARQEKEARKAKEALAALKIKQEAERKAKEEEERRKAEAAAAAAQKKAREEEELRKQREALAVRIIKPLSQEWTAKVIAAMAGTRTDVALTSGGIPLTRRDLGMILPQTGVDDPSGWLNDEVINRYFGHLTLRAREKEGWKAPSPPTYHNFSSAFMDTLKRSGPAALVRWANRAKFPGAKLLDLKQLLIPICAGMHWRLVVVYPAERRIEYLDSLSPGATKTSDEHVHGVKTWLAAQLKDRFVAAEWATTYGRSGIQSNCNDCGVFTCFNGFALVRGFEPKCLVTADLMPDARRQMAATLLNEGFVGEFDWE